MSVEERIAIEIKESGMTVAAVCRKTGISPGALYPSMQGRRDLRADEFLALCDLLRLEPREVAGDHNGAGKGA